MCSITTSRNLLWCLSVIHCSDSSISNILCPKSHLSTRPNHLVLSSLILQTPNFVQFRSCPSWSLTVKMSTCLFWPIPAWPSVSAPVRHSRSHYCLTNLTLSPSLLHLSTLTKFFLDLLLFWLSDKDNKTINQRHFLCKLPFVQQASIIVPGWSRGSLSQGRYDRHNWLYLFYIYPSQMPGYFPYLHV